MVVVVVGAVTGPVVGRQGRRRDRHRHRHRTGTGAGRYSGAIKPMAYMDGDDARYLQRDSVRPWSAAAGRIVNLVRWRASVRARAHEREAAGARAGRSDGTLSLMG